MTPAGIRATLRANFEAMRAPRNMRELADLAGLKYQALAKAMERGRLTDEMMSAVIRVLAR
jgi:hypothetical protein